MVRDAVDGCGSFSHLRLERIHPLEQLAVFAGRAKEVAATPLGASAAVGTLRLLLGLIRVV